MTLQHAAYLDQLVGVVNGSYLDHFGVDALGERAVFVVDIRYAARHARRKVAPGAPDYQYASAGHVFAAVIAHALDYSRRARIAHAEALAGYAVYVRLARCRAV